MKINFRRKTRFQFRSTSSSAKFFRVPSGPSKDFDIRFPFSVVQSSGQAISIFSELLQAGARDKYLLVIQFKKGKPRARKKKRKNEKGNPPFQVVQSAKLTIRKTVKVYVIKRCSLKKYGCFLCDQDYDCARPGDR